MSKPFRRAILSELARRKMTQADLAAKLGSNRSNVGRVLSAKHAPTTETVDAYAEALGLGKRRLRALAGRFDDVALEALALPHTMEIVRKLAELDDAGREAWLAYLEDEDEEA